MDEVQTMGWLQRFFLIASPSDETKLTPKRCALPSGAPPRTRKAGSARPARDGPGVSWPHFRWHAGLWIIDMKYSNPFSACLPHLPRGQPAGRRRRGAGRTAQDLASIQGVRGNQLIGYGLVVGLDGSGDQVRQTPFTQQSLTNMLSQLGITVPAGSNMQLKNVAAVMVTATLPAFARPGQTMDVVVSSMGNAKSLRGGTLLMTPLKGADSQVYAIAQGNILVGGAGASAGGSSVQINQLNGAASAAAPSSSAACQPRSRATAISTWK